MVISNSLPKARFTGTFVIQTAQWHSDRKQSTLNCYHHTEILSNTWRSALFGCNCTLSRGCFVFILWLQRGNFSFHRLVNLLLKCTICNVFNIILHMYDNIQFLWDVKHFGHTSDACWPTLMSVFLLASVASSLFFHMLLPFWKRLRIWASSDSRSWNEFFVLKKSIWQKIIATIGYTIVTVTYQLLSLGEISSGCVCSLGSSESFLYQSCVWCDWWGYGGNLVVHSAPCWGALVGTLLALLTKALQKRFYSCKNVPYSIIHVEEANHHIKQCINLSAILPICACMIKNTRLGINIISIGHKTNFSL